MAKDILFTLTPGFDDPKAGPYKYFCPACAYVEGVLSYNPALREALDIRKIDFPRPRPAIIELIGETNQGCPVLVLAGQPEPEAAKGLEIKEHKGRFFINEPHHVSEYLGRVHGSSRPHP